MHRFLSRVRFISPTPLAWAAVAIGLSAHFIGFFLFRIQIPELNTLLDPEAYVTIIHPHLGPSDSDLMDRILLSDDSALFLPSIHDYAWQLMQPSSYLEERGTFLLRPIDYPVDVSPERIIRSLDSGSTSPLSISEVFSPDLWDTFTSLGEGNRQVVSLPDRFGAFGFHGFNDPSNPILVSVEHQPEELAGFVSLWNPSEFLVLVGEMGSIGEPLLRVSSGFVAVDRYASRWIVNYCNRQLPEPGYYRVIFGP